MDNQNKQVTLQISFETGAASDASFAQQLLLPLFLDGTIPQYPGADFYAICYGELCAYSNQPAPDPACAAAGHKWHLATWSVGVPDCIFDAKNNNFLDEQAELRRLRGGWRPRKW